MTYTWNRNWANKTLQQNLITKPYNISPAFWTEVDRLQWHQLQVTPARTSSTGEIQNALTFLGVIQWTVLYCVFWTCIWRASLNLPDVTRSVFQLTLGGILRHKKVPHSLHVPQEVFRGFFDALPVWCKTRIASQKPLGHLLRHVEVPHKSQNTSGHDQKALQSHGFSICRGSGNGSPWIMRSDLYTTLREASRQWKRLSI